AVATKLYTWPAMIVLFFGVRRGSAAFKAALARRTPIFAACAVSMAITVFDLATRTRNPFGVLGFDPAAPIGAPQPIRYLEMIKITLASAVWTSGQHWDALTLAGMLLYAVPVMALLAAGIRRTEWKVVAAALAAFAAAQIVHAYGYIRRARAMGPALPAAGKEGWFR